MLRLLNDVVIRYRNNPPIVRVAPTTTLHLYSVAYRCLHGSFSGKAADNPRDLGVTERDRSPTASLRVLS